MMDPDQTLQDLIGAAFNGDRAGFLDAALALSAWLDKGGFAPRPFRVEWPVLADVADLPLAAWRADAFEGAWRAMDFRTRVAALDFIAEGAIDEDTAEGVAREWAEPS